MGVLWEPALLPKTPTGLQVPTRRIEVVPLQEEFSEADVKISSAGNWYLFIGRGEPEAVLDGCGCVPQPTQPEQDVGERDCGAQRVREKSCPLEARGGLSPEPA